MLGGIKVKKYAVKITEILERVVHVNADNEDDAQEQVEDGWHNGDYVLDAEDFVVATFELTKEVNVK